MRHKSRKKHSKKDRQGEKGISAIVAIVLMILIVIAGIGIVWGVLLPFLNQDVELSKNAVTIDTDGGHTLYDENSGIACVQVVRNAEEIDGAKIVFVLGGSSHSVTINSSDLPEAGGKKRYCVNLSKYSDKPTSVSIFAIKNGVAGGAIVINMPKGDFAPGIFDQIVEGHNSGTDYILELDDDVEDPEEDPECVETNEGVEICGNGVDEDCDGSDLECEQEYFVFQIDTNKIPTVIYSFSIDMADITVDWGDGEVTYESGAGVVSHDYGSNGIYNISLNGSAERISFYIGGYPIFPENALVDVLTPVSDGVNGIISGKDMFKGTSNFGVTSLTESAFFDDVSENVVDMEGMFEYSQFNQGISNWDVSSVTSMRAMFRGSQFNQGISNWDVSSVTDMLSMFEYSSFNQDISDWDVSNVANMGYMFYMTESFSPDISSWDVSSVISMAGMFERSSFNQDISDWDVSNVANMAGTFSDSSFNQDISKWDVSSVTSMYGMFFMSKSFDQNLSSWNVSSVAHMEIMFEDGQLSTENYDSLLIGWASLPSLQPGLEFNAGKSKYCMGGDARDYLINNYGWYIMDYGQLC